MFSDIPIISKTDFFFMTNHWSCYGLIFPQVTFLLTEDPSYTTDSRGRKGRRRKRSQKPLSPDRFSLYSSLSSLSGGLTIFTTNSDIHSVSTIVEDNIAADKVWQQEDHLVVIHFFNSQVNQIKQVYKAKKGRSKEASVKQTQKSKNWRKI